VSNTKKILNDAINYGGSSIRDFKNISGAKGNFQKIFKVYQRDGLKCKRHKCKGIIKKKIFQIDQLSIVIFVKND